MIFLATVLLPLVGVAIVFVLWYASSKTWSRDLAKRVEANQDVTVDLLIGAELVEAAQARAGEIDAGRLGLYAQALRAGGAEGARRRLRHYSERRRGPPFGPPAPAGPRF